jgi:hypothetical protein
MMETTPKVRIDRFAQLSPGDLFIFAHENGMCVAIKVVDPANDDDMLVIPLGSTFPTNITCPTLMSEQTMTVIAFEKDYALRLPSQANGWCVDAPPPDKHCFAVTERGIYLRTNFAPTGNPFQACYVDIKSGAVLSNGRQYILPIKPLVYAIEWGFFTNEKDPRVILSYPT